MARDRYYARICKNVQGVEHSIGIKEISPINKTFKWKKLKIPVDLSNPTYRARALFPYKRSQAYYYLVDLDNGQKTINEVKTEVSREIQDLIFSREIVRQLAVSQRHSGTSGDWIFLIMGAIGGLGLGYILAQVVSGG